MWARLCGRQYLHHLPQQCRHARCASAVKWQPSAPSSCTAEFVRVEQGSRSARASAATSAAHGADCAIASCENSASRSMPSRSNTGVVSTVCVAGESVRITASSERRLRAVSPDCQPFAFFRSFVPGESQTATMPPAAQNPYGATASSPLAV